MTLPQSFTRDGYKLISEPRKQGTFKRLLLGTDGWPNTGKTEFALSAPEPIMLVCLDRGIDSVMDNPRPPVTRAKDIGYKIIPLPLPTQFTQQTYSDIWRSFYDEYRKVLENQDVRTVIIDGDSDSWELQRLAAFGKVTQVPSLQYPDANAARKVMVARAWDSGKIVISTNKLEDEYKRYKDAQGKDVSEKTGKAIRQGFKNYGYLWQVQITHLYDEQKQIWGLRIWMCKSDTSLRGMELWGEDCNFKSLVQTIYPQISLKEWGYR